MRKNRKGYISIRSRAAKWGTNAIGVISDLLQQELPGLRGFSETNIKRMRIFYEEWRSLFDNRPLLADELEISMIPMGNSEHITIRPLTTDELSPEELVAFLTVGFSNHYEILAHAKEFQQRLFYIGKCATGFWSGKKLLYYLGEDLFSKEGTMPNNFALTITDTALQHRALNSFKDEYFLDLFCVKTKTRKRWNLPFATSTTPWV